MVEGGSGARMGVFLHQADKSFYGTDITFYRKLPAPATCSSASAAAPAPRSPRSPPPSNGSTPDRTGPAARGSPRGRFLRFPARAILR